MKIQRISEYQYEINFLNYADQLSVYRKSFLSSELGRLYAGIPWEGLVEAFGLEDKKKGPSSIFSPRGKIALMFLKHFAGCSDRKLIEQLNGNLDYQFFCDIHLPLGYRLTNYKIVSAIRMELASCLNIDLAQSHLVAAWLPFMKNVDSVVCDATCYESSIRYPTDIKLLWESVAWSYDQLKYWSKKAGVKLLRTKYNKWSKRYISYAKMRRKTHKKNKVLRRALLHLLRKISDELYRLEQEVPTHLYSLKYRRKRATIEKVYEQQLELFVENKRSVKDRIVSLDKPYVRPIVRGKENKRTEFGAKVHKFQIDGLSFIEHLSFDAFNEGRRLKETIFKAQRLTGKKVKVLGADAIYATNVNRTFVSKHHIKTDFKPKGRRSKHYRQQVQLCKMISKERVSRLEGSFGTDKEHFLLKKNLARTKATEMLMIFFGIHISNALEIGRRMAQQMKIAA